MMNGRQDSGGRVQGETWSTGALERRSTSSSIMCRANITTVFWIFLAMVLVGASAFAADPDIGAHEYTASSILYGDVSGDGIVSAYDAALTAQATVSLITLTPDQTKAAEVSGDGKVTAYDAALIAQKTVGLIDKFPVESPFTNPLAGYNYRKTITVQTAYVDANLTGFPLYVRVDSTVMGWLADTTNFYDIRFTDTSGNILPYECESASASGGNYWVKTDISTAGTTIYCYYNNIVFQADGSNAAAVWDSNFKGVYHAKDGPDAAHIQDSTSNNNDGTKAAVDQPVKVRGRIGNAQEYDGIDDVITVSSDLIGTGDDTVEAWVRSDSAGNLVEKGIILSTDGGFVLRHTWSKLFVSSDAYATGVWSAEDSVPLRSWTHVVVTRNSSGAATIYVNGSVSGSSGSTGTPWSGSHLYIGCGGSRAFDGLLDEVRISNIVRSPAWLKFEYHNMVDQELTWGEEESFTIGNRVPVLDTIGNKSVTAGRLLSFTVSARDHDVGDTLTYSAYNLPSGATFDANTRTFSWTPRSSQVGRYNVTFSVSDGKGGSDYEDITITITPALSYQSETAFRVSSGEVIINGNIYVNYSDIDVDVTSSLRYLDGSPTDRFGKDFFVYAIANGSNFDVKISYHNIDWHSSGYYSAGGGSNPTGYTEGRTGTCILLGYFHNGPYGSSYPNGVVYQFSVTTYYGITYNDYTTNPHPLENPIAGCPLPGMVFVPDAESGLSHPSNYDHPVFGTGFAIDIYENSKAGSNAVSKYGFIPWVGIGLYGAIDSAKKWGVVDSGRHMCTRNEWTAASGQAVVGISNIPTLTGSPNTVAGQVAGPYASQSTDSDNYRTQYHNVWEDYTETGAGDKAPTGDFATRFSQNLTRYGCADMEGNVFEWNRVTDSSDTLPIEDFPCHSTGYVTSLISNYNNNGINNLVYTVGADPGTYNNDYYYYGPHDWPAAPLRGGRWGKSAWCGLFNEYWGYGEGGSGQHIGFRCSR